MGPCAQWRSGALDRVESHNGSILESSLGGVLSVAGWGDTGTIVANLAPGDRSGSFVRLCQKRSQNLRLPLSCCIDKWTFKVGGIKFLRRTDDNRTCDDE